MQRNCKGYWTEWCAHISALLVTPPHLHSGQPCVHCTLGQPINLPLLPTCHASAGCAKAPNPYGRTPENKICPLWPLHQHKVSPSLTAANSVLTFNKHHRRTEASAVARHLLIIPRWRSIRAAQLLPELLEALAHTWTIRSPHFVHLRRLGQMHTMQP